MSSSLFDLCYKYIILQALLKKNIFLVFCVFLSLSVPIICLPALTANIFSLLLRFVSLLRQHFCCIIFFRKVSQPPFVGFIFYTWEQVTQFLYSIWFVTKLCKSSGIQCSDHIWGAKWSSSLWLTRLVSFPDTHCLKTTVWIQKIIYLQASMSWSVCLVI